MNKLFEIFYEGIPVAFVKEKFNGAKKCQRLSFSENLPDVTFSVPTPVYNKFKEYIRTDNRLKTIKAMIKKITDKLDDTDLSKESIEKILKYYVDMNNDKKPIFTFTEVEQDDVSEVT